MKPKAFTAFRPGVRSSLAAEWWHIQYEGGLEKGVSNFENELLKVYAEEQVRSTPPWQFRNRVYGVHWF
ncbi:MAG: hypothetical protein QNJ04_09475 [Desulfobacterales bacterium]|nr:hypothetical protein [Desulfobacterales bacterium]